MCRLRVRMLDVTRLPQGNYFVEDKPVDWSVPDVPVLPYGEYRLNVLMGHAENLASRKPYFCYQFEGFAHPRV